MIVGTELELRLVAPREAVVAAVRAAAVRVERPVERHALDGVQRRPAGDFLIARRIRPPLRLVERRVAPLANVAARSRASSEASFRGRK